MIELAFGCFIHIRRKCLPNLVVERRIFAEPDVHAAVDLRCAERMFLEPEREDGVDAGLVFVGDGGTPALGKKFD